MSKTIIQFDKIRLQRFGSELINGISFQLRKGEHLAIVGQAGTGKSSLLEAIARKSHIRGGEATFPLLEQVAAAKRAVNPTFAFYDLISLVPTKHSFRDLSNTSNLYYQQRFNSSDSESVVAVGDHLKKLEAEAYNGKWTLDRLEERLSLRALHNKQLIKLSNGETKRLLLATALIRNPLLLLLDSPLTGLDPGTRKDFSGLLEEVADSGINIVMTTFPKEVPEIMTHVGVISNRTFQCIKRGNFNPDQLPTSDKSHYNKKQIKELMPEVVNSEFPELVVINHAIIRYDEHMILNDVSWKVNKGERWLLKGHNGAGKSTLLSLINADNPQAYSQDITLFGRRKGTGESIFDIKRKIGFVSAELYQYFPGNTSCAGVIESGFYETMGLFRTSKPQNRKTCISWMELLGISEYANALFKNTSESVQRLCLLARAMVKNPPLLILDEPCQGLDIIQQADFKVLIESICHSSDIALIYVSHFQEALPDCLNHVLELKGGKVVLNQVL